MTFLSPTPRVSLERRSRLLLDWRAEDAMLRARSGQLLAFTRASVGGVVSPVGTINVPSGYPRFSMVDTDGTGGVDAVGMRVDKASAPRVAEVVSVPLEFTLPDDLTVYIRHAPNWYATSGALASVAYLFALGTTAPRILLYRSNTAGQYAGWIDTSTTDATATVAAPTTRVQEVCMQVRDLHAGGRVKVDAGAGFGTESAAAAAFTSLVANTAYIGTFASTGNEADSAIFEVKMAAGLFTLSEMRTKS